MAVRLETCVVMDNDLVRIDELRLMLPGLTQHDARRLGREVARRLNALLPAAVPVARLDVVELQLTIGSRASLEQMADAIVATILKRLQ